MKRKLKGRKGVESGEMVLVICMVMERTSQLETVGLMVKEMWVGDGRILEW